MFIYTFNPNKGLQAQL